MRSKVNEISISYKECSTIENSPSIKSSSDAAELLFENWDEKTIALN